MYELTGKDCEKARPVVRGLDYNLSLLAVIDGMILGHIWVDDLSRPRAVFALTPEAQYLAGDPRRTAFNQALAAWYAQHGHVELIYDSEDWEPQFEYLLAGKYARKLMRRHYVCKQLKLWQWREQLRREFEMRRVDADFLRSDYLENFEQVSCRLEDWGGERGFLEKGLGYCLLHENVIVSHCIADNVSGEACEIGIGTDQRYRRRGLAALTVAAMVEYCLSRGYIQIGWHCLENNIGSWKTAEKVGFELERAYPHCSNGFPAENPADLSAAEWREHAEFHSRALAQLGGRSGQHCYLAAVCWAIGGENERALAYLEALSKLWWEGEEGNLPTWIIGHWAFDNLRAEPAWEALVNKY
ncbi:MAG: GNAT family N-acetyltransferase [Anaerolineales bacterium]|nr:GNAT family N-acetyltransferase [Anaerolineales bacterium]